jgi:hypothetical protein
MAELQVLPHVIEQMLNHQSGHKRGVAGIYNHALYEGQVRAALTVWADHVKRVTGEGPAKVVPLRSGEGAA